MASTSACRSSFANTGLIGLSPRDSGYKPSAMASLRKVGERLVLFVREGKVHLVSSSTLMFVERTHAVQRAMGVKKIGVFDRTAA